MEGDEEYLDVDEVPQSRDVQRRRNRAASRPNENTEHDEPALEMHRELSERFLETITAIQQEAYDSRPKGSGQHVSNLEKVCKIVQQCMSLPSEMLAQVQSTVDSCVEHTQKPRILPPGRPALSIGDAIDHMPKPNEAFGDLGQVKLAILEQKVETDPRWLQMRDQTIPTRGKGAHTAFWGMWRSLLAAGCCPTELISHRECLEYVDRYDGHDGIGGIWAKGFCEYLKHLVLGSSCGENIQLLLCFIRLTAASRIDDHRAVPISRHGQPAGTFFAKFADEMTENTDGKKIIEVLDETRTKWEATGLSLPWESHAVEAICKIDWRERAPAGRFLTGTVGEPYEVTTDHLRRLIKVFDASASHWRQGEFQKVEDKAKASQYLDKKHRVPNDMEGLNRLRKRSLLLDMCFEERQEQQDAGSGITGFGVSQSNEDGVSGDVEPAPPQSERAAQPRTESADGGADMEVEPSPENILESLRNAKSLEEAEAMLTQWKQAREPEPLEDDELIFAEDISDIPETAGAEETAILRKRALSKSTDLAHSKRQRITEGGDAECEDPAGNASDEPRFDSFSLPMAGAPIPNRVTLAGRMTGSTQRSSFESQQVNTIRGRVGAFHLKRWSVFEMIRYDDPAVALTLALERINAFQISKSVYGTRD